ncbi:NADP oxidoreductase [Streptococcus sanguinis]|nr:NADP oxidoreductase [Streptococcus sanguinis]
MSVYSGCLKDIMTRILNTAETYGLGKDYLAGANIAAFENVANAMIAQGICLSTIKLE